ncbi:hypothetical protein TEA_023246 [Camellia sinensis var. sinensis]|uniref:Heparan-alpha-glucosaminide N-acetyltransferase catalytic domain-containing protein n=1 Tax=Camellia sinensis var. sinensis TaxID=542762 RepID=A0A4S4EFP0_CAMSN|nr:hypothetical protein TEA_023246 [Camellia sinensis var. sinensis]
MADLKADDDNQHRLIVVSQQAPPHELEEQQNNTDIPLNTKRVASLDIFRGLTVSRIALAYLVVALIEILTKDAQAKDLSRVRFSIFRLYCWHWLVGACVLIVYLAVIYGIYVPDWHFTVHNMDSADYGKILTVTCGVRGKLDPPCNAVGYIDREVLGINHMYEHPAWKRSKACTKNSPYEGPFLNDAPSWCWAPFEPEGILRTGEHEIEAILKYISSLHPSISHCFPGAAIPLNKQLYTFSYVCVTSGAAALVFSAFYTLVDIWNLKYLFLPLEWIGMNAMLVYVMAAEGIFAAFINGWYYGDPHNTLFLSAIKEGFMGGDPLNLVYLNQMAGMASLIRDNAFGTSVCKR